MVWPKSYSGAAAPEPGHSRLSKLTLPVRLALLVTGTMLPLIVFAVGIAVYNYQQDRGDATRRVLENVRSMRLVLDSEVQRMTGGLQVLALTNSLRNGDFESFRRIALGFGTRAKTMALVSTRDTVQSWSGRCFSTRS